MAKWPDREMAKFMNIYVEHDAAMLARMAGQSPPACDGLIVAHRKLDDVIAATIRGNPLGEHWLVDVDLPSKRIVAWSGTLGDELFEAHPMTWMKPGRETFDAFCGEIAPQLAAHGRTLCFQPHSRHVLSDVQSCFNFVRDNEEAGVFEIALSPATMFEPSMLKPGDIEDHLDRMFSTLGDRCAMVFLSDVRVVADGEGECCEPIPFGADGGLIPLDQLRELVKQYVPEQTPMVLRRENLDQQIALLRG